MTREEAIRSWRANDGRRGRKYVIELSEYEYAGIVKSNYPNDTLVGSLIYALKNGKPLDAVLDEIRAEIEVLAKEYDKFADYRRVRGLWIALDIIDKYKAEGGEQK